jgi:hypothetical protein
MGDEMGVFPSWQYAKLCAHCLRWCRAMLTASWRRRRARIAFCCCLCLRFPRAQARRAGCARPQHRTILYDRRDPCPLRASVFPSCLISPATRAADDVAALNVPPLTGRRPGTAEIGVNDQRTLRKRGAHSGRRVDGFLLLTCAIGRPSNRGGQAEAKARGSHCRPRLSCNSAAHVLTAQTAMQSTSARMPQK